MKAETLINKLKAAAAHYEKIHGHKPVIYAIRAYENKVVFCKGKLTRGGITTIKEPYMTVQIKGLEDL